MRQDFDAKRTRPPKKPTPERAPTSSDCHNYWEVEFPNLAEKTRSIISLTFSMLARPLITRPLRELFSADTNINPEDTFDGKIIIVDLPVQEFRLVGRIANLAWKYCFKSPSCGGRHRRTGRFCGRFFYGQTRRKISLRISMPNIRPPRVPLADAPCI